MSRSVALRLAGPADVGDLEAFLDRVAALDPATLVRIRAGARDGEYLAAYAMLPFDVLVSRGVRGALAGDTDVTVPVTELVAALRAPEPDGCAVAPSARRDARWRGTLPPASGWRLLDTVPVGVVRGVVAAGVEAFRAAQALVGRDPRGGQAAADALLDHGALTVSDDERSVVLPLRVLQAASRMGFLGVRDGDGCAVAVRGRWARLAAPYGTAYRESGPVGVVVT